MICTKNKTVSSPSSTPGARGFRSCRRGRLHWGDWRRVADEVGESIRPAEAAWLTDVPTGVLARRLTFR